MTNTEINAAISAWFEPKPEPLDWVIIDQPIPSAKGFWLHTNSGYERGDVSVTIPLDYFTSEDANARLLDELINSDRQDSHGSLEVPDKKHPFYVLPLMTRIISTDADRKTAIVLEFCKFAGIAHKRDGGET